MVAKRSAAGERTQTMNQVRALVLAWPDELRARFTRHTRLRWWPGRGYATRIALRELGRRADAALPEAHEGFGSLRRPKASGQPRGRRPGTQAPRRALRPRASTPYRWPAPARPGATYLRNSG
jgi:hypothetical protein